MTVIYGRFIRIYALESSAVSSEFVSKEPGD